MLIALLMGCLVPLLSTPTPSAASSAQTVVDAAMADTGAMLAADSNNGVSLVDDDHEAEDGLARMHIQRCATPPPMELRVHAAPSLREHCLAMELRPPIG
ncbi:hypothetical protein [Pinirhizobacter sp.]|jgi:hypothetical protein|uniref:hypothetical protein n=1 Tax=Pinirhizobacter sp. TaxID=2950432 RepID=UPI002F3FA303